jgi:soluble lytic murein transglycosylase-like protein
VSRRDVSRAQAPDRSSADVPGGCWHPVPIPSALPSRGRLPPPPHLVAVLLAALAAGVALAFVVLRFTTDEPAPLYVPRDGPISPDPLAYDPAREQQFEQAAAQGLAHPLYRLSPGGVVASAERTARFRPLVEAAVAGTRVDADLLEALILLESAGRPDAIAGGTDPARASGLVQIVAETGLNFLEMPIDLEASTRLTRRIRAARAAGDERRARTLEGERRDVDPRFDPERALAGAVRYLTFSLERFGRSDLAFTSYHMGIGNLEGVLRAFAGVEGEPPSAALVRRHDLSYARVFFDSSPRRNAAAWTRLARLGDRSRDYYWRLLAAREVMHFYRADLERLRRLAGLHTAKNSAEEVLRPPDETERYADADELAAAWEDGRVQPLPDEPQRLGFTVDGRIGALAERLEVDPALYRGLRPDALALLVYLAAQVRAISAVEAPLVVTSAVRDERYQGELASENVQATRGFSLHTTGYAFDILREYASDAQAAALQFVLERLEALSLIAWVREPEVIHVTVGPAAAPLVPALLRRESREALAAAVD